jgi:hypothetical protein
MKSSHIVMVVAFMSLAMVLNTGCKKKDDDILLPRGTPRITNINSAGDPKSPTGVAIEINGKNFGFNPGQVRFEQGANIADVIPDADGWSSTSIVVIVPDTGSGGAFTVPGTVTVYVITAGGTSNGVDLDLVDVPTFSPGDLTWTTTTALPDAKTGLKAAALAKSDTEAYLYISGGQTATTGNMDEVLFVSLTASATSFTVGGAWTAENPLPEPRAFHAMVSADSGNAPVAPGNAYLYVIGGQADAADTPGGTRTVWVASVNTSNGSVGMWRTTSSLPRPRIGHAAFVYRGCVFVVGGCDDLGDPTDTVYVAQIMGDGSLGNFKREATLPLAVGYTSAFAFGGRIYVVGGEVISSTDPNDLSIGNATDEVHYAQVVGGEIGTFAETSSMIKNIKKHLVFNIYGQVIRAEGIYNGWGSSEFESATMDADGLIGSWGGLTGSEVPGADVFNCAGAISPIQPGSGAPRFFIIGGMDDSGIRQSTVYVNTGPP